MPAPSPRSRSRPFAATAPYAVLVGGDTPANALDRARGPIAIRGLCRGRGPVRSAAGARRGRRTIGGMTEASVAGFKYQVFRAALNTLYFSGAYRVLRPLMGGVGAILMLHHVRPSRPDRFQPNHLLEVTPKFFERVIRRLRRSKVDLISLDEMHRRLTTGDFPRRRFVCVTFDDGYRDNLRIRLSGAEEIRGAVRDLRGDELRRPDRRTVVARARSRDRAERHDRAAPRRPRPLVRVPQRRRTSARCSTTSTAGCGSVRPRRNCGRSCAI